jgi:hypothetical protein
MVGQEVVHELEGTISLLKEELKRLETTHKQLILRYAALKSAVDESFEKHEKLTEGMLLAPGKNWMGC